MKILFTSIFLLLIIGNSSLSAQIQQDAPKFLMFTYDESGNQIEREFTTSIILPKQDAEKKLLKNRLQTSLQKN